MTHEALVTLIVTPRERFAMARRSLESIVANTRSGYRLVYVAGGATRSVQEYLQTACAANGFELIVRPEFLAPNAARNLGLERATTRYVAFLDNDVVVEPGWLEALVRCAEEEQADLVSPLCLIFEPEKRYVHSLGGTLSISESSGQLVLRERHHLGPICLRTSPRHLVRLKSDYAEFHCCLVRRSVFERIGPADEQILGAAEHIDLALHLRAIGGRGFAEPEAVVSYLPVDYTLADHDNHVLRWSEAWHFPTMDHLREKWNLSSASPLFHDYRTGFAELRDRCLLRSERVEPPKRMDQLDPAQTIVQLLNQMAHLGYPLEARTLVRQAYGIATQLSPAVYRASGRPLTAHLVGTSSVLAAFGANPQVLVAAVLHTAYALGQYPDDWAQSVPAMRRWLRRRIGSAAEDLVYRYSRLSLEDVSSYSAGDVERVPIPLAHAVLIRVANGIEDRVVDDELYFDSAHWLADSNAQIERWLPCFTQIAERLDVGGLTAILRECVSKAQPDSHPHPMRTRRPLNYTIEPCSGALNAINARVVDAHAPSGANGQHGKAPIGATRQIGLDAIRALNGGSITCRDGTVQIVADPQPWAYSAYLSAGVIDGQSGAATIALLVQAQRGVMGVMALERGSSVYQVVPEQSVVTHPEALVVRLEIEALEDLGNIVFRGWSADEEGRAILSIIAIGVDLHTGRAGRWFHSGSRSA
jgi:hypothetical protein